MTPLQLMILLHYFACANDFRDGDFSAPAVRDYINDFRDNLGLLTSENRTNNSACYAITERGRVFVEHLLSQPLPVQVWAMPSGVEDKRP